MVSMGTAVFCRIVREAESKGFETVRKAAVAALSDTMHEETIRFGNSPKLYVDGCAAERLKHYMLCDKPNCGNQIYPHQKQ